MTYEGNCRLGDLFTSRREKGREGLPTLSVTLYDGLVNRDNLDRKQDTNLAPEEHLLVKPGDIVYNMMRMWQGAYGLANSEGLVSPAYVVLKPKANVDSRYASYLFETKRLTYLFWAYSYGLTDDRLRLYPNDFVRIPISVPPKAEQTKLAQQISTWDAAINVTQALIGSTVALKAALARKLIAGEIRLPGYKGKWRPVQISDMGRVVSGGTPDTQIPQYWGGDILWATPTDIARVRGRYIYETDQRITDAGLKSSAATLLPPGSVLVCTRATICELAISTFEIATNQGFKSLIPSEEFSPDFLYYLFSANKHKFVRLACGSTFLELSKRDFERITFDIPHLNEQKAIADCLGIFDDQLTNLQRSVENLRTQKEGLLQRHFKQQAANASPLR